MALTDLNDPNDNNVRNAGPPPAFKMFKCSMVNKFTELCAGGLMLRDYVLAASRNKIRANLLEKHWNHSYLQPSIQIRITCTQIAQKDPA